MNSQPLFSILVANYNNGVFFKDCWHSIISQTYDNWEVIIVDDCSTDASLELIQHSLGNESRVRIYKNDANKGCGFTKRKCVDLASGVLCGFVDPDDVLEPNALELMVNAFENNPNMGLVFSRFTTVDEKLQTISEKKTPSQSDYTNPYFFNFGGIISHFAVFKREVYLQTLGIDAYMHRAVDQDLYLKLCEKTEVLGLNDLLYKYRIHTNGISTGGNEGENVSKASYWHWYAINAAAKRREIYVEELFTKSFFTASQFHRIKSKIQLIENSGSYKLAQKLGSIKRFVKK